MGLLDFGSEEQRAAWMRSLARSPATLLGGPVDLVNMLMGLAEGARGRKVSDKPVMGSQWIAEKTGMPVEPGSIYADIGIGAFGGPVAGLLGRGAGAVEHAIATAKPAPYPGSPQAQAGQVSAEGLNKAGRAKRIVGTTKQYVGAPPGIDSPAKFNNLINGYVDRIDEALKNGVERDYFYRKGTAENRLVTDSRLDADKLAMLEGVTSSEAPVLTNTGWAVKALEQDAMGAPISTGKYPNANRAKVEDVLAGDFSHIGEKTHRYASGLAGDVKGKAPNDRWEIRSFGYTSESAGPTQHAFMDEVRQRAVDRWAARHPTEEPLTLLQGQELNWVTQRARDMKVPHSEAAADNVHDSLRAHTIQHSWESVGGEKAGHLRDMTPEELPDYHRQIQSILLDESGKDNLVRAFGGKLQYPSVDGPGVYEGFVAPGTQSRSIGYMTNTGGLDPTTAARVQATEAARALGLGQDMYSAHGLSIPKNLSGPKTDTFDINMGRTINEGQARTVTGLLDTNYGGAAGIVPTEGGFRVLRYNDNPTFAKTFESQVGPQLSGLLDTAADVRRGSRNGIAENLDWGGHNATRDFLSTLNNPAARNLREYADSPETRGIMGQLADVYDAKLAAGKTPSERLPLTLRTWQKEGVSGLEELVRKGLAAGLFGYGLLSPNDEQTYQ